MNNVESTARAIADGIRAVYQPMDIKRLLGESSAGLEIYQDNPVGFVETVLGETPTDDIRAMMESVRDHEVTLCVSANAVGKTWGAARVAAWWKKCFPNSQVYTAAAPPEDNLRRLLWGEIGSITQAHPLLFRNDFQRDLHIQTSPKEFITGVAIPASGTKKQREAKFSGKHAPNLLFILDEADAIPDEVYSGIESCMSGGNVRLLMMFNPREQLGEPYRMERDGRAHVVRLSAFNHPNVLTGEDVIPGAVTREATVRRINEWCRPLKESEEPNESSFQLPPFLEGSVAKSKAGLSYPPLAPGWYRVREEHPEFNYMVLGQYPAEGLNQVISRLWVAMARGRWEEHEKKFGDVPPKGVRPVMGFDIAEEGDDKNAVCFRFGNWVARFTDGEMMWSGVDIVETSDRGAALYHKKMATGCFVDGTGVGAGVAPHMRRKHCTAEGVKVATRPTKTTEIGEFTAMRDQLWWAVRQWLMKDNAMLPPDEELEQELTTPTYRVAGGKIKIMAKDKNPDDPNSGLKALLGRSPNKADALCLTFSDASFLNKIGHNAIAAEVKPVEYVY